MHRFLLTGMLALSFGATACGIAGAAETVAVTTAPSVESIVPQTAAEGGYVSPAAVVLREALHESVTAVDDPALPLDRA